MSAASDEIKGLLALRDSLNSSIDAFIDLSNEERAPGPKVNQARQKISSAARKLATEVANPQQEATALAFAPWLNAVIRTALELNIFNLLGTSTTASELAEKTGADEALIGMDKTLH
ncbi:hypothetical protein PV10_08072 [Exophiala mesophila]|uniref:Uncharacterized protein n=1 Tax=Exophiala mesophila TaxID=212818 RepID=A0A0D1WHU5_EXOME|nr:uncharacterized protein PV10_08072 [Exophiala mesophila]KIV88385.1 hypothetical protein PV10_08072 [Exophiala mesophila]